MLVYKNNKKNLFLAIFYYTDWIGKQKRKNSIVLCT